MDLFLDTNYYIDLISRKPEKLKMIENHNVYLSVLSVHVFCYVAKLKAPCPELAKINQMFGLVSLDSKILSAAMVGPTNDLEDNIQLHSAVYAGCEVFLTEDNKLLKLGYFGKMRIAKTPK